MKSSVVRIIIILAASLNFSSTNVQAQLCSIRYFSALEKSTLFDTITHALFTPAHEVVTTGTIMDLNGFVRKYSAGGTLLWSKRYNTVYQRYTNRFFGYITLHNTVCTGDSGYIVTGSVSEIFYGFGITLKHMGLIMNLDRYGNLRWGNQIRTVFGDELSVAASLATREGDFIAYISTDNGPRKFSFGKLMCYDHNGNIKWSTFLNTKVLDNGEQGLFPKRGLLQLANGHILLGDVLYTTDSAGNMPANARSVLHIAEFDQQNGKIIRNTGYQLPWFNGEKADITAITESANHELTFYTSLRFAAGAQKKVTEIITDPEGLLLRSRSIYTANGTDCNLISVTSDPVSGKQTLFLDAGGEPVRADYDPSSGSMTSRTYQTNGHFSPAAMTAGQNHDYIFLKNLTDLNAQFIMTDSAGSMPCAEQPFQLVTAPAYIDPLAERINNYERPNMDSFIFEGMALKAVDYPMTRNMECQSAAICCNNTTDSSHVDLCPGEQLILPDRTVIRDSGTYYVTLQSALGCDSVKFYIVSLMKDPKTLDLGQDTCLTGQSSITLKATPGFSNYNWHAITTTIPEREITSPGLYQVTVSNSCGSSTDSIHVYDQCAFPVYMPSGFTPNGDGLNDVFRVPVTNKNHLVRLQIFNRWGQLIFSTSDPASGWDGTVKGKPADTGTYVYYLQMKSLTGNPVNYKGAVTLIR